MASIQFFPIDLTYRVIRGKAVIYMYGRTNDGKQICLVDENFEPYFLVIPKQGVNIDGFKDRLLKKAYEKRGYKADIVKAEIITKKYNGKDVQVIKAYANLPKAVPNLRHEIKHDAELEDQIEKVLEADIQFTKRYLIDKKILPMTLTQAELESDSPTGEKSKVPVFKIRHISQSSNDTLDDPKILAFDIETYNPLGKVSMPEKFPVVMIALYGKNFRKVLTWKKFKTKMDELEVLDGEAEMIERFKEIIEEQAPDIITGYYSGGFDFPYLLKRAEKYKIKLDIGLDYSEISPTRGAKPNMQNIGLVHMDVLPFIRRVISMKMNTDSFTLNAVAHELLGAKKYEVDMEMFAEHWDDCTEELDTFARYNLQDAKLTYELCEKILPNVIELVKLVGLTIFDINDMSFSQLVEWYLMRRTVEFNHAIPNKPGHKLIEQRMYQRVKGAFVYEPTPGLYEDIAVFDFRSLYPTVIVAHNISPETLNCDCCEKKDLVPLEDKELWFCRNKEGFFSSILKEILERRARVKSMMKSADPDKRVLLDARQYSLKILLNAFYGYLGFYAARWYSKDSARAVTAYARHYIHSVIDAAKKQGFKIIYGDTDSVFLSLKGKNTEDALKFVDDINAKLPEDMELEYEGFYPRALFVQTKGTEAGAKKRYAMISEDKNIVIKGFETVRRNWSFIAKDMQKEVIRIILDEKDVTKALDYVKGVIQKLRKKEIPLGEVVIHTQITRPLQDYESIGPHVAAAKRMQNRGDHVGPGTIVKYVIAQGTGIIRDRARLPDEITQDDIDAEYYIKHQIVPSVDRIFEVLGHKKEELLEQKSQSKLDGFF